MNSLLNWLLGTTKPTPDYVDKSVVLTTVSGSVYQTKARFYNNGIIAVYRNGDWEEVNNDGKPVSSLSYIRTWKLL
jgi:hypothetical protein